MAGSKGPEEYCTTGEAAERLGVSLRTIQLMVEKGTLQAWKTDGGHRRILRASVAALQAGFTKRGQVSPGPVAAPDAVRILVVEDDAVLCRLYQTVIASWRLPVELGIASNGIEGLIRVGKDSPDLLVTDLAMPAMDGFELVRNLVALPFRNGMEIVVVTGLDDEELHNRGGLPAGVRVFPKPVPFAALRSIVESLLARRRQPARGNLMVAGDGPLPAVTRRDDQATGAP